MIFRTYMLTTTQLCAFYLYGIPIWLLNLRTIYVLRQKRNEFSSSYYKLFFLSSVNDCLLWILNNILVRLAAYEPMYDVFYAKFEEFSYWFAVPAFLTIFCSHTTNFLTLVLSLNRLSTVWIYLKHARVTLI